MLCCGVVWCGVVGACVWCDVVGACVWCGLVYACGYLWVCFAVVHCMCALYILLFIPMRN